MTTPQSVAIVLGTRPEIIKFAPIIDACERRGVRCLIIHTGQHYSPDLDSVFFEELELPEPDYNLGVGSGSHGVQTGTMLASIESVFLDEAPDVVLVQGDTNSTLAGALAAVKLGIPVGHVEAGLRSYDREMPEEINRVVVDHVADFCFPPTPDAADILETEHVPGSIHVTGNTIVDAIHSYRDVAARKSDVLDRLGLEPGEFYLLTAHRAENVDDAERFASMLDGVARVVESTGREAIYPIHPRSKARLVEFDIEVPAGIRVVEPLPFLDFLRLESTTALAFTDSGGVQEETCILGVPCVTMRYSTERPETVHVGANCVAGTDAADIVDAAEIMLGKDGSWPIPFGGGDAAERIMDALAVPDAKSEVTQ
ncbi:UDP-N-acetylglucosamine 2-epimerase [Haloferax elongans ATCC BAA-1513]|uniref:UDP-N-acetylglucosamine 2-epimerase n=1 Tax=Haloferax elongans ATCC BAA-1513 TaxID=1230453 RepID=M0HJM7_HALEO|nr:UDP-N-acetylglucosamine 2-epimerase (non-hydrolyzing) [Haloferax elongans]ELZ84755.1 UDP-N-acetylglucosamine 2-epimerase [Haloferax elongans ATCC BAA-1513]